MPRESYADTSVPIPRSQEQARQFLVRAVKEGMRRAVWAYAVHKDGEMLVGVAQRPLRDVWKEIDTETVFWRGLIDAALASLSTLNPEGGESVIRLGENFSGGAP